ncbi:hypothetical protein [Nitratireductor aquibiodomus]|uniref:hypothetical protein n=1 Tax=Nitratireductor aquibiodomus TaxID=204799 RepID=UPI0002EC64FB|nr:hypothetical protein [Nitratireductor aquibiodomus]
MLLWVKPSGKIVFAAGATGTPSVDDRVVSFTPARDRRAASSNETASQEKA